MPLQRVMAATHSVSTVLIHRIHGAPRTVAFTTSHAGAVRAGWCVISTKRSITIWLAVLILPSLPAAITRPCPTATMRRPSTASSRAKISTTTQPGSVPR